MYPEELTQELIELFPQSESEFQEEDFDIGCKAPATYHKVWLKFSPIAFKCLSGTSEKSVFKFACILNRELVENGDRGNAVSTCFLEHASKIGVSKFINTCSGNK